MSYYDCHCSIYDCIKYWYQYFTHNKYLRCSHFSQPTQYIPCENDNCYSKFILHENGYKCVKCDRKICENCSDKGDMIMDDWNYVFTCERCIQ